MPLQQQNTGNVRTYWGNSHRLSAGGKAQTFIPQQFDLTYLQKDSYDWFIKEGIGDLLASVNPVTDFTGKNWKLEFGEYTFGETRHNPQQSQLNQVFL